MADKRSVGFRQLTLNDPKLGLHSEIHLRCLQQEDNYYGGIANLIAVWQSNVTINHLEVSFAEYEPAALEGDDNNNDNEHLIIQPILEHLIRNRTQLRKLTLSRAPWPQTPATLELIFQFMEAATQNVWIEELNLSYISSFPVSYLARFFRVNRNIKRLAIDRCGVVASAGGNATVAVTNNDIANALQTLHIKRLYQFSEEAASEVVNLVLHPSNQNLVELELGHIVFDNDKAASSVFFGALLGRPNIKRLRVLEDCLINHFEIIMNVATNIQALSVDFDFYNKKAKMVNLTRMKCLLELNLTFFPLNDFFSEEDKSKFVRAVEQHPSLRTITLQDPGNCFTPAQQQQLRTLCGDRNAVLRELVTSAENEDQLAPPPQVPRLLTTCHNCPTAALALLLSLKDKVGPPKSQKRLREIEED